MGASIKDADLLEIAGMVLESQRSPAARYRLETVIGEGAHGVVYLARQQSPDSSPAVVIKVLRPRAVRDLSAFGAAVLGKEVAALERLSERDPPTPYVVRYIDSGSVRLSDSALLLPWLAVEYVDGGSEGTTLRSRVESSVLRHGHAFDLRRAHQATRCIVSGVAAIHEVGVIHRDVTPSNVLCAGSGESEIFKIGDFGLARVHTASTFGSVLLGTPGYCAPEQSFPEKTGVGPYSDVFGMACTLYYLLTGGPYFDAPSIAETLVAVLDPERRSISEADMLCPELREQSERRLAIDRALERATRANPEERPQSAEEFGAEVLPYLAFG